MKLSLTETDIAGSTPESLKWHVRNINLAKLLFVAVSGVVVPSILEKYGIGPDYLPKMIAALSIGSHISSSTHELGHAVAAMLCGEKIENFMVGFNEGLVKIAYDPESPVSKASMLITTLGGFAGNLLCTSAMAYALYKGATDATSVQGLLLDLTTTESILVAAGAASVMQIGDDIESWLRGEDESISDLNKFGDDG